MTIKYLKKLEASHTRDVEEVRQWGCAEFEEGAKQHLVEAFTDYLTKKVKLVYSDRGDMLLSLKLTIVLDSPEEGATKVDISKPVRGRP
jgi:hypothetical protein